MKMVMVCIDLKNETQFYDFEREKKTQKYGTKSNRIENSIFPLSKNFLLLLKKQIVSIELPMLNCYQMPLLWTGLKFYSLGMD